MNTKYFSINRIIGLVCMLLFVFIVTFSSNMNFVQGLIFFILGTIISVVSFYLLNKCISVSNDDCWLRLAAFVLMMILCKIFLRWDFHFPFFIAGLLAMSCCAAVNIVREIEVKNPKPSTSVQTSFFKWFELIKLFAIVFAVLLLMICICVFVGVMV